MASPSDPQFWRDKYAQAKQGWELGRPAPPLERWFAAHPPTGKRALVVGCGRGHEARMLARAGAHVVAVDFAPEALAEAQALAEREAVAVDFRLRDL
ncbi:MAG TPA: methyltransferase domain-containing protein, partial [Polyangia bacterium]